MISCRKPQTEKNATDRWSAVGSAFKYYCVVRGCVHKSNTASRAREIEDHLVSHLATSFTCIRTLPTSADEKIVRDEISVWRFNVGQESETYCLK